jgi:hypothetical protein
VTPTRQPRVVLTWQDVVTAACDLDPPIRTLVQEIAAPHVEEATAVTAMPSGSWFLRSLEVRGHIGVGAVPLRLKFVPATGIVVVSARNGIGKTSAADGLRRVLSGGMQERGYELAETNLHCSERMIKAIVTNGSQDVEVSCADNDPIRWSLPGQDDQPLPEQWVAAYGKYNPVLLYPEIASTIQKPSELHKFMEGGLSLDVLKALLAAVDATRKAGREAQRTAGSTLDGVLQRLRPLHLAKEIVEKIEVAGALPTYATVAELRVAIADLPSVPLKQLNLAPEWQVDEAVTGSLQAAIERLDIARVAVLPGAQAAQAALAGLANEGGSYLEQLRGEDICPACGTREANWLQHARETADELAAMLKDVREAELEVKSLIQQFRAGLPGAPSEATRRSIEGHLGGISDEPLQRWAALASWAGSLNLNAATVQQIAEMAQSSAELSRWYQQVKSEILATIEQSATERAAIREHVDIWLKAVDAQRPFYEKGLLADRLGKQVEQWIKDTREALFEPISAKVRDLWSALSSDGDLTITDVNMGGGVRQAGKINIGLALGELKLKPGPETLQVLSTGQRNALSLATYFPRATQPGSPFNFLVLDDPVQAFDVWRVRFLARLLADVAKTHQVIVLTHDERLWHELRAQGQGIEHIRLSRKPGGRSSITATNITSPGAAYLEELEQVLNTEQKTPVGTDRASTVMTLTLCRQALDAELSLHIEVLGRRAHLSPEEISEARDRRSETRDQLNLLNEYAELVGARPVVTDSYKGTISTLNSAAHGRALAEPTAGQRKKWIKDTRQLIKLIRAVAT